MFRKFFDDNKGIIWRIWAIVGLALVLMLPRAMAWAQQDLIITLEIDGAVNGSPIAGVGTLSPGSVPGQGKALIYYSKLPDDFSVLAVSSSSIVSAVCGGGGFALVAMPGVLTIFDVTGGNFDGTMRSIVRDSEGNIIGDVQQEFTVRNRKGKVTLSGWYKGPLDLVGSPGYEMILRQQASGQIVGTYTQVIFRADRSFITSEVTRVYRYDSGRTLPFDEMLDFRILEIHYEPPKHEFTFFANFWPAKR